ncbi:L,D-transpeptidase [Superficieibacter sp. BNK-5]|uniref:L,D-transpeptidase n=1 Tax=Superficieibacter sp. BNK-5 TaxID=3376142 RepID=UPI0039BF1EA8
MAKIIFDGKKHIIMLISNDNIMQGKWVAYNNVDSRASFRHINNGNYQIIDTLRPHWHIPDPNGPYGSYGIIRFNYPGHPGIGIHSGRANSLHDAGPKHATMGCIRTTDDAMLKIKNYMGDSPLTTIEIINNSGLSALNDTLRNASHIYTPIRAYLL